VSTYTLRVAGQLWTQNANDRMNHWKRSRLIKAMREAAWAEAKIVRLPFGIKRASITVVPLQGPRGPDADPGAYWPPVKAAVDGLRDARCLVEDTKEYVAGIELLPCERVQSAREQGLVLTIVETPDPRL
jgi:hypothetical protein